MAANKKRIQKRPRAFHYVWAVLWLTVFGVLAMWWGYSGFSRFLNSLEEFQGPGITRLTLEDQGVYTVFYEDTGERQEDGTYKFLEPPPIQATLTHVASGEEIPVEELSGDFQYNKGNKAGRDLFQFAIAEPGDYLFETDVPSMFHGLRITFQLAYNTEGHFLWTTIGAVIFGGLGWIGTITIAVILGVIRRRSLQTEKS